MASASHEEDLPPNEKEIESHVKELENVQNQDELDEKINTYGAAIGNWMKYIFNRDTQTKKFNAVWLTIDEYKRQAEHSLQEAWSVVNLPDWKIEKKGSGTDVVESKTTQKYGKVYRFTGMVDCPAVFLYKEFKEGITKLPEWNPTILRSELIKEIGEGIDLSYQVTAGGGGGLIAQRDFVILRRNAGVDRRGQVCAEPAYSYVSSGVSVEVPGYPPTHNNVRGHNKVGCWCLKPVTVKTSSGKLEERTVFQWLMCCDLKGKIPQFVLDTAFSKVMFDYIIHVRKHVAESKSKGLI